MRRQHLFAFTAALLAASIIPAHADPISALIVAVLADVGVTATIAAVNMFLIGTAVSIGLSLISGALNPTPKQQSVQQQVGINTTLQSGGIVPRAFIIGQYATPGSEIYPARTWGNSGETPNAYFTRFIDLSDLPSDSLSALIVSGKLCTYGAGAPDANLGYAIPEFNLAGVDHLWVKFHDGTQTSADDFAVSQFGGDLDYPYTSDMVGYGVTWVLVTALIEPTLFSSFPDYTFILNGAKLYDPRADSTAGGSGPQTWADPTSWALTLNPVVVKYNVLRGIYWNGQWLFGMQGTAAGRLPLDSWFAAMNVCDFAIDYQTGVSSPQFQCGAEISVNTAPADVLDELNKCDNGRIAETGGIFKTRSGAVGSAVMSFTDKDLISTESKTFDQFPGLEDTVNGITATYPEPAQLWAMTDAPSLFDATLEAQDNDRRLPAAIAYNYVPYGNQVQFLMKSARDEDRNFRKHTVIAPPSAFQLEVLDVISWSSDENGYSNKLFTAIPTDQDNVDQGLVLTEVDPADYDWTPGTDRQDYTPVNIIGRAVPSQAMSGWAVSGEAVEGDDGREVAAIVFAWGITGIVGVNGVQYEVRLASDSSLVLAGETDRWDLGGVTVDQNIVGNTSYQARGRYRPSSSARTADWSSWLSVTTPNILIGTNQLQDALLTWAKFAAGLTPVQQVSSLGSAIAGTSSNPTYAVLTSDGKLYKNAGSGWVAVVNTTDLTGTITTTQIGNNAITTPKLAANSVTATQMAANSVTAASVDADAITAGAIAVGAVNAGNEIVNNILVTGHLVANAVSNISAAAGSGDTSFSVNISGDAYAVLIIAAITDINSIDGVDVLCDGSSITSGIYVANDCSAPVIAVHSPSPGAHTYSTTSGAGTLNSGLVVIQLFR